MNNEYLWDLSVDRGYLRRMYHMNSQSIKQFKTVQIAKVKHVKEWKWLERCPLPEINCENEFEFLASGRRTRRELSGKDITIETVSRILKFSLGKADLANEFFNYPSPGALYPTVVFVSLDIDGHREIVYRYNPYIHCLEKYAKCPNNRISNVIIDKTLRNFPVKFLFASDYQLLEEKYGDLSYRLLCQEMGHMAQNVSLNSVCIGGFYEDVFKEVTNGEYDLHYVMVVG